MTSSSSSLLISQSIGSTTLLSIIPDAMDGLIVLGHGAGAGMTHPFMEKLAQALAAYSLGTIRYNFPYMEKKTKRPDAPAVAEKTVEGVVDYVSKNFEGVPLYLAGKSFGGRMSSQYYAKKHPMTVKGIVFYGFPLHPVGQPGIDRAKHLGAIHIPMLFLQGTKDALAALPLIEQVCADLSTAQLVTFEGADHSFKVKKIELVNELTISTVNWLKTIR